MITKTNTKPTNYVKQADSLYKKRYTSIYERQLKKNWKELEVELDSYRSEGVCAKWLEEKIKSLYTRKKSIYKTVYGIQSWQELLNNIVLNPEFEQSKHLLVKDPKKQRLRERLLELTLSYEVEDGNLESMEFVGQRRFYPISVDNEFKLLQGSKYIYKGANAKSVDFIAETLDGRTIYIYHKGISDNGGGQDSESTDVDVAASCFLNLDKKLGIAIMVLDGPYYNEKSVREKRIKHPHCIWTTTSHISEVIAAINRGEI